MTQEWKMPQYLVPDLSGFKARQPPALHGRRVAQPPRCTVSLTTRTLALPAAEALCGIRVDGAEEVTSPRRPPLG